MLSLVPPPSLRNTLTQLSGMAPSPAHEPIAAPWASSRTPGRHDTPSCRSVVGRPANRPPPQRLEYRLAVEQLDERAFVDDPPLLHQHDAVEAVEQMQAVHRGDQAGVGKGGEQGGIDPGFGRRVDAAGRLVEHEERAVAGGEDGG